MHPEIPTGQGQGQGQWHLGPIDRQEEDLDPSQGQHQIHLSHIDKKEAVEDPDRSQGQGQGQGQGHRRPPMQGQIGGLHPGRLHLSIHLPEGQTIVAVPEHLPRRLTIEMPLRPLHPKTQLKGEGQCQAQDPGHQKKNEGPSQCQGHLQLTPRPATCMRRILVVSFFFSFW